MHRSPRRFLRLSPSRRLAKALAPIGLALAALAPGVSLAGDGVIEINAASAAAGSLSGDSPGYPTTIRRPGSYRLVGNLEQLVLSGSGTDVVQILADDVTLDLNGFRIECHRPTIPQADPCDGLGGFSSGIVVQGENVEIRNGTITGMPYDGISAGFTSTKGLIVRNVRSIGNGGDGLSAYRRARIEDSEFTANGAYGLYLSSYGHYLRGVHATENAGGLYAGGSFRIGDSYFEGGSAGSGLPLAFSCSYVQTLGAPFLIIPWCP